MDSIGALYKEVPSTGVIFMCEAHYNLIFRYSKSVGLKSFFSFGSKINR